MHANIPYMPSGATHWVEPKDGFQGYWAKDGRGPDLTDGVQEEDVSQICPHCGTENWDGWNCHECGEPLMW
jgi:hypothetical protein